MSDNWKHRSQGMRCKTCVFFVAKVSQAGPQPCTAMEAGRYPGEILVGEPLAPGHITIQRLYDLGRCRRHAPTLSGWPAVFVNDWCGDHRLDEKKLHE